MTTFGIPESELGAMLQQAILPENVTLAYCVNFPSIFVKLRGKGTDPNILFSEMEKTAQNVRAILGNLVVAQGNSTIDTVVAELFRKTGATLALAESCTGGLISKRITDIPGSSEYFLQGAVTYSNGSKERLLGISDYILESYGAVSHETAEKMAIGIRESAGSDIGVSVTGVAGPDGGSEEKPVGTVFIALANKKGCIVERCKFRGNRDAIRNMTSYKALDIIRRCLLSY
jgi:nicotinamide-nucleotide amidase